MNVTLISSEFAENKGGIPRYSYNTYKSLKNKINIKRIELTKVGNLRRLPIIRDIAVRHIYFELHKSTIKNKNVHLLAPFLLPKYLSLPKKKIVTVHDFYIFDKNYLKNIYYGEKSIYKRIFLSNLRKLNLIDLRGAYKNLDGYDHILVINKHLKEKLINGGINEDKISISLDIIPPKFHHMVGLKNDTRTVIGYINSFPSNKLIKLKSFIEIFKKIKDPTLEFRIYGSNFPLIDLIKNDTRIKYYGFLPENKIVKTYNTFDVYLSTSTIEGFGLPIIQAKACKIPVLCFDGDLPEISKRNTVVWNENNIESIITNRKWKNLSVEKAYNDTLECSEEKVTVKLLGVYKKIFEN